MIKPRAFGNLLLIKLALISFASIFVAIAVTGATVFAIMGTVVKNDIKQIQWLSAKEIDDHLATGWTPTNVAALFHHLNVAYPEHNFALIKSPTRDQNEREKLSSNMKNLLNQIETQQTHLTEISLMKGSIVGGTPIFFESKCLKCHQGTAKLGEYAGTLLFNTPMSGYKISLGTGILFMVVFLLSFLLLASLLLKHFLENTITQPLKLISNQLGTIRLDEQLEWQRNPHAILEIDDIDAAIHTNIAQFKNIYDKLDAVQVTEHETGFFLANHFNEALKFEIYRCQRYQHQFSLITIKLHSIEDLDKTQNRTMQQKLLTFSQLVREHIRNSDMPFRISENLFVLLAPEMDEATVVEFHKKLINRFCDPDCQNDVKLAYNITVGYATYPDDAIESKGLTRAALERMGK
ncbi:diguanylate cyclase domain-containing protein [Thiosulfativibrio zosterae]|uniref:diguanylate cyclase domain-containing protein n=1 Tax=Thiosulfativibrio zosterae TaxID=2675053 RepID=UPI0015656C5F|nr:diguanylate cyclase [Thiosulfativibrio zosterae]